MGYVFVFIGGGLGSICRFMIAQWMPWKIGTIPWGTFTTNLFSCILIGVLLGMQIKSGLSNEMKWLFSIGFCGGFSTFSTFTKEIYQLIEVGYWTTALVYILISILLCIVGVFTGLKIIELST